MLNFHKFLHTVYKYVLNSVVRISLMFAQYFEYYAIILRGGIFCGHTALVHGQVTIIFVVSVGLSVCLFVCLFVFAEFFSAVFDPISIKLGRMLYVWV